MLMFSVLLSFLTKEKEIFSCLRVKLSNVSVWGHKPIAYASRSVEPRGQMSPSASVSWSLCVDEITQGKAWAMR